jgi:4-amino-4-deoxychorismate lyase
VTGRPLALAVLGRGVVDPGEPLLRADDDAVLRGRAAFETLRVYAGVPFRLDAHLERLASSARVLDLPAPDAAGLATLAADAVAACAAPDAVLRLVWTPGPDGAASPQGFALVTALPAGADERRDEGMAVVSLQLAVGARTRRASPWLLGGVKSTSYAVNMAAQREARRRGAEDALFVSLEGLALEGPTSNVWFREGERLCTPALELGILAGVTRDALLERARAAGVHVEEGEFPLDRVAAADEAFFSSSVREVMPVVRLDGQPVGDGRPGPTARRMQAALREQALGERPERALASPPPR